MANVDAPRGLKWVGSLDSDSKPTMDEYVVKDGETIYKGGIVQFEAASGHMIPAATATVTANTVVGGAAGTVVGDGVIKIPVWKAPNAIFEIQMGTSTTQFDTLLKIQVAIASATVCWGFSGGTAAASGLDQSAMELSAVATGTDYTTDDIFKLVGYPMRPGNDPGDNVKLHVMFTAECQLAALTPAYPHVRA